MRPGDLPGRRVALSLLLHTYCGGTVIRFPCENAPLPTFSFSRCKRLTPSTVQGAQTLFRATVHAQFGVWRRAGELTAFQSLEK